MHGSLVCTVRTCKQIHSNGAYGAHGSGVNRSMATVWTRADALTRPQPVILPPSSDLPVGEGPFAVQPFPAGSSQHEEAGVPSPGLLSWSYHCPCVLLSHPVAGAVLGFEFVQGHCVFEVHLRFPCASCVSGLLDQYLAACAAALFPLFGAEYPLNLMFSLAVLCSWYKG